VAHCDPVARESVPRFDLYAELEVSPTASVEVIEAAFRSLVKRHHPDVAAAGGGASGDGDRIKRLNLAREWLTDAERRGRYDRAMGFGTAPRPTVRSGSSGRSSGKRSSARSGGGSSKRSGTRSGARSGTRSSPREDADSTVPPAQSEDGEAATFGLNSHRVRQFLADLRALDEPRALQLRAGRFSVMHPDYQAARRRMFALGREHREAESQLAREAAGVIVRGKVTNPQLAEEIATVAADIAGAIALRDLLSRSDFELLLAPWTWRGGRLDAFLPPRPAPAPTRAAPITPPRAPAATSLRPTIAPRPAHPLAAAVRRRSRSLPPGAPVLGTGLAAVVLGGLIGVFALGNLLPSGPTDAGSQAPSSTILVDAATDEPSPTEGSTPTPEPPTPTPGIDPALLGQLQRGAAEAIQALTDAAAAGDVATARALTGGTAPGLRRSGLAAATFPAVTASGVTVMADGDGWLAVVGGDTLRSTDGETWTFDYANRPLAVFDGTPDHDLFWLDPRHDLFLRVVDATITRTEVVLTFEWSYDPADASFFDTARMWLSSLTIGNRIVEVDPAIDLGLDPAAGTGNLTITGEFRGASKIALIAAVTPPSRFTNQSAFELTTR